MFHRLLQALQEQQTRTVQAALQGDAKAGLVKHPQGCMTVSQGYADGKLPWRQICLWLTRCIAAATSGPKLALPATINGQYWPHLGWL